MRPYNGIVCEKKTKYMIFLTKEGKFLRGIPLKSNPEIGQEVEFHLYKATTLNEKWAKPSFLAPVIVAAVFLLFVIVSFIPTPGTALAYVQLDAKNSVELGVDQEGLVVTLRSLNESAPIQLEDWEGNPVDIVLANAVKLISPIAKEIAITTIYENNIESSEIKEIIEVAVEEVQSEHTEKVWTINESSIEERKEADKHNISIQKLKEVENESKIEDNQRENGIPVKQDAIKQETPSSSDQNNLNKEQNKEKQLEKQQEQKQKHEQQQQKQQEKARQQQEKINEKQKEQKAKPPGQVEKQQNNNGKSNENQSKDKNKENENQQKNAEKAQKENEKSQKNNEKNNNSNGNNGNGNNNGNN
ncbi:anti-sigma factor domain-containing protein [Psychrobacillus sp. FJAT-51614]|uniref:Anti-sigma factor domain-containing protein n=1 Tax=Psychrobacillus mangrovi TaxID=3117745 RepID=A0ABU8F1H4_9BACI